MRRGWRGYEFAGELSLAGELRPVRGALAMALALQPAAAARARWCCRPAAPKKRRWCRQAQVCRAAPPARCGGGSCCRATRRRRAAAGRRGPRPRPAPASRRPADLRDVKGQAAAKRALEIAAAGGHSLLMVGPPGIGKSMLAQRFAGLLPPMDDDEALASAAAASLTPGGFHLARWAQRPTARAAPHAPARWRWWAAAHRRGRAKSRWRTTACCSSTNCRSSRAPRWRRCASRWRRGRITISRAARQAEFPAALPADRRR